jgi:hypothetical protein
MSCLWRCCVPDAEILRDVRRNPQSKVLDLTGQLPPVAANAFVQQARHGLSVEAENAPAPVRKRFELMPRRSMNMLNVKPRARED